MSKSTPPHRDSAGTTTQSSREAVGRLSRLRLGHGLCGSYATATALGGTARAAPPAEPSRAIVKTQLTIAVSSYTEMLQDRVRAIAVRVLSATKISETSAKHRPVCTDGERGQPESLSEIDFLERGINHLQKIRCL